jgi:3'-phosphoadenosine 5'-phosphosulfate sulfotransferase (PAPS reductase)/FAD synthetase
LSRNPYMSQENTTIAFSGGRTSAFMLYKVLEAYDGKLPNNFKVCFANTGKEMPETLDFVRDCQEQWGVDVVWLERYAKLAPEDHKNKYISEIKIVDHSTAARKGEPFSALIETKKYAPNVMARFCTTELKIHAMVGYVKSIGWELPALNFVGIRGDEQRRAAKLNNSIKDGSETYLPLWVDKITKHDVYNFWENNSFNLNLPSERGVTNWGNCDLCFLKGRAIKLSIIRERPDLADWWIQQENNIKKISKHPMVQKNGRVFNISDPSYSDMKIIASSQDSFNFDNDETIPCFCGD